MEDEPENTPEPETTPVTEPVEDDEPPVWFKKHLAAQEAAKKPAPVKKAAPSPRKTTPAPAKPDTPEPETSTPKKRTAVSRAWFGKRAE